MQALGFEPRPPERLQPECSALDRLGHACFAYFRISGIVLHDEGSAALTHLLAHDKQATTTTGERVDWLRACVHVALFCFVLFGEESLLFMPPSLFC